MAHTFEEKEQMEFLAEMVKQVPELKGVYKEHKSFNGEVLSHILMAEITRFIVSQHRLITSGSQSSHTLDSCLGFLEEGMKNGTEGVQEVISLSFLENLAQSDDLYFLLRSRLGPALRTELRTYEDAEGIPPQAPAMPDLQSSEVKNVWRDFNPGRQ
jgi:hypothetical protein